MRILLFVTPIALLVACSQVVIKWRTLRVGVSYIQNMHLFAYMLKYLSDPIIVSAYVAALLASFVWLYVITKLPLVVASLIYIVTSRLFLSESITEIKPASVFLILSGIIVGVRN